MCLGGGLWVHFVWDCLCFLDLCVFSFTRLGMFQPLFLQTGSRSLAVSLLLVPLMMHMNCAWCYPRGLLDFSYLKKIFFLFVALLGWFLLSCSLNQWFDPLLHDLLLIPSSVFFTSDIVFFNTDWFFFMVPMPFLMLTISLFLSSHWDHPLFA